MDTEDYAEEFIRAVVRLSHQAMSTEPPELAKPARSKPTGDSDAETSSDVSLRSGAVLIRKHNGIWEVTVGGRFHGDHVREEHAVEAAALAARN